jgi:hypothetical protein
LPSEPFEQPDLVLRNNAGDLRLRPGAQDHGNILGAGAGERLLKAVLHCQEGQQHNDHKRYGNNRRQRQPEALRQALQVHRSHRSDLQQQ